MPPSPQPRPSQSSDTEALRRFLVREWEGYCIRPSGTPPIPGRRSVTIEQVKARLNYLFANPEAPTIEVRPGVTKEELELVMPQDAMSRLQIWLSGAGQSHEADDLRDTSIPDRNSGEAASMSPGRLRIYLA
jgi:hypothetical protein